MKLERNERISQRLAVAHRALYVASQEAQVGDLYGLGDDLYRIAELLADWQQALAKNSPSLRVSLI